MEDENIFQVAGRLPYQITDETVLVLYVHRMNAWSISIRRSITTQTLALVSCTGFDGRCHPYMTASNPLFDLFGLLPDTRAV